MVLQRRVFFIVGLLLLLASCATLKQAMAIPEVKFSFDRISEARIAGVDMMAVQSLSDLNFMQLANISMAISRNQVPMDLTVFIKTENPVVNQFAQALVALDWTLVLDGRDTIKGTLNERVPLPSGQIQNIPLQLSFNMTNFFTGDNATDMLDLAMAFAGNAGQVPKGVALKITPTIETPFGPVKYKEMLIEPKLGKGHFI